MVGGAAVNLYGYKRHSADIDFWVSTTESNLNKLLKVLQKLGYDIENLPPSFKKGNQNISIKISPEQEIELISRFNPNKSFEECFKAATSFTVDDEKILKINALSLEDLIASKAKSKRSKDLLDIQELFPQLLDHLLRIRYHSLFQSRI